MKKIKFTSVEILGYIGIIVWAAIFILALGSEIVHDIFLGSSFDRYDILITVVAQLLMFFVPVILNHVK